LKRLNLIAQRFRSKTLSSARLFHYDLGYHRIGVIAGHPAIVTQSLRGEGKGEGRNAECGVRNDQG
jgi:hypothetical protein